MWTRKGKHVETAARISGKCASLLIELYLTDLRAPSALASARDPPTSLPLYPATAATVPPRYNDKNRGGGTTLYSMAPKYHRSTPPSNCTECTVLCGFRLQKHDGDQLKGAVAHRSRYLRDVAHSGWRSAGRSGKKRQNEIAKTNRVLGLQRTPHRNRFVAFSIRGKSSPRMVVSGSQTTRYDRNLVIKLSLEIAGSLLTTPTTMAIPGSADYRSDTGANKGTADYRSYFLHGREKEMPSRPRPTTRRCRVACLSHT